VERAALHNEKELLLQAAAGSEAAFKSLFVHHWPQVYGTSLHLTKSPELAKDLAQDLFLKLWEHREKLAVVNNVPAYLYTLSRNLVIDFQRRKVFHAENVDYLVQFFASPETSAQQKLEYRELEQALEAAVNTLPNKTKAVFRLSRYEGLSHDEIASTLGISVHSSRTYITRALAEIRDQLSRHSDDITLLCILLLSRK
jgi:RNA polymerase sigma-70 factor (ECF subfamily)